MRCYSQEAHRLHHHREGQSIRAKANSIQNVKLLFAAVRYNALKAEAIGYNFSERHGKQRIKMTVTNICAY